MLALNIQRDSRSMEGILFDIGLFYIVVKYI